MVAAFTIHCCLCGGSLFTATDFRASDSGATCSDCQRVIDQRPDWTHASGP